MIYSPVVVVIRWRLRLLTLRFAVFAGSYSEPVSAGFRRCAKKSKITANAL